MLINNLLQIIYFSPYLIIPKFHFTLNQYIFMLTLLVLLCFPLLYSQVLSENDKKNLIKEDNKLDYEIHSVYELQQSILKIENTSSYTVTNFSPVAKKCRASIIWYSLVIAGVFAVIAVIQEYDILSSIGLGAALGAITWLFTCGLK